MKIVWLLYLWVKEAVKGFFRNMRWNLAAIILTVLCLGGFALSYILGEAANDVTNDLGKKVEVQVDLKETIPESEHQDIAIQLGAISNVQAVKYESKEEIYAKTKEKMDQNAEMLEILDENPFDARFILTMEDPNKVEAVAHSVEQMNIAENVDYGAKYVDNLLLIINKGKKVAYALTIIVAITAIYIMSAVIKMNIDQRINEIKIKQLTGSGFYTIRMPFLIESMIITILSAGVVYAGINMAYNPIVNKMYEALPYLKAIDLSSAVASVNIWIILLSVGIAVLGTILGTFKNLEKIKS